MSDETTEPVPTCVDDDGVPHVQLFLSPEHDKTRAECTAPPSTVIPIVFVPGVMGSNLKATEQIAPGEEVYAQKDERVWNVETTHSPASWAFHGPAYRQAVLNKDGVMVDNSGNIPEGEQSTGYHGPNYAMRTKPSGGTPKSGIALAEAKTRGWGGPGWGFYGDFLDDLDYQLNQGRLIGGKPDGIFEKIMALAETTPEGAQTPPEKLSVNQIKKTLDIWFPVYAVGYNWLQSNLDSGQDLVEGVGHGESRVLGIKEIIKRHDESDGQTCEQVILVSHSMGGLVARAGALKHGVQDKILGIVHGVLPIDGAAKFYKDIAAGFSGDMTGPKGFAMGHVLGATAREATPELAYNPGPLELAPNKLYNGGHPWLFIKDAQGGTLKALPERGDPYEEIYKDTKHVWRAVNPSWLNPVGSVARPALAFQQTVDQAWGYHDELGGQLHPQTYAHWGEDKNHPSWGELTWTSDTGQLYVPSATAKALTYGAARRQWISKKGSPDSDTSQWAFSTPTKQDGESRITTDDSGQSIRMTVDAPSNPGDGTVPAAASGARVANYPGCQIACSLKGFVHQDDYNDTVVKNVLLDALVRLVEPVKIT